MQLSFAFLPTHSQSLSRVTLLSFLPDFSALSLQCCHFSQLSRFPITLTYFLRMHTLPKCINVFYAIFNIFPATKLMILSPFSIPHVFTTTSLSRHTLLVYGKVLIRARFNDTNFFFCIMNVVLRKAVFAVFLFLFHLIFCFYFYFFLK